MRASYIPILLCCLLATACMPTNLTYSEAVDRNSRKMENEEQRRDAEFLVEAADYNLLLKELSDKAATNGYARIVTDFAKENQNDHEIMGERLRSIGKEKKIALPAQMSDRHTGMLRDMEQANRTNVDRIYLNTIELLHERLLRLYETAALEANDAEIRSFAAAQLDIIRSHNRKANDMRKELI